jgi:hypothetical protein
MATFPWGENAVVLMELGFLVNKFVLDDATYGKLDGIGVLDGTLLGDDVSSYCREISISRGRSDQLQAVSAGTATFTLVNNDRRFDPINTSSPYWDSTNNRSGVTPRRKVTVTLDGETVFTGRITDIDVSYEQNLSTVSITASDDFVLLANTTTGTGFTPPAELSGTRVTSILDLADVNYPATSRSISSGTATFSATALNDNENALTYLQKCAESEQGYFYVSGNGTLTFTNRIASSFATIAATFSDTGTNIPYSALSVRYGQEFLYNKVICQTSSGTPQEANDVASQTEWGISTLSLSDLLLSSDADALTLSERLLSLYSIPQYRFDNIGVNLNRLTAPQRATVLGLEIADVISLTRTYSTGTPSSVTQYYSIEGISHKISPAKHEMEIRLAPADLVYPLILDDATSGVLDSVYALS